MPRRPSRPLKAGVDGAGECRWQAEKVARAGAGQGGRGGLRWKRPWLDRGWREELAHGWTPARRLRASLTGASSAGQSVRWGELGGGRHGHADCLRSIHWRTEASFIATASRMRALNAFSSIFSPSCTSIARRRLPSRTELNRREGSFREAPLAKVTFTWFL